MFRSEAVVFCDAGVRDDCVDVVDSMGIWRREIALPAEVSIVPSVLTVITLRLDAMESSLRDVEEVSDDF